jgi:hypothetical protein
MELARSLPGQMILMLKAFDDELERLIDADTTEKKEAAAAKCRERLERIKSLVNAAAEEVGEAKSGGTM